MKVMQKTLAIILLAIVPTLMSAQETKSVVRPRLEIASVETDEGMEELEVFRMGDNGRYYLSVGHLGMGNDVIQVNIDPLFELFIPLGESLTEAIETLGQLKTQVKQRPGSTMEVQGCLSALYPNDKLEPVTVTTHKLLLTRQLEFSVQRDGYIRAGYITRSSISSLLSSVKFYRKIHPKEN